MTETQSTEAEPRQTRLDHLRVIRVLLESIEQKGCCCEPEIDIDTELNECAPCMARAALRRLEIIMSMESDDA